MEKNVCMTCGKKSKNRFKHRVLNKEDDNRDFCSTKCLLKYYKLVLKQEDKKLPKKVVRR